jgi:hypothetical protein
MRQSNPYRAVFRDSHTIWGTAFDTGEDAPEAHCTIVVHVVHTDDVGTRITVVEA